MSIASAAFQADDIFSRRPRVRHRRASPARPPGTPARDDAAALITPAPPKALQTPRHRALLAGTLVASIALHAALAYRVLNGPATVPTPPQPKIAIELVKPPPPPPPPEPVVEPPKPLPQAATPKPVRPPPPRPQPQPRPQTPPPAQPVAAAPPIEPAPAPVVTEAPVIPVPVAPPAPPPPAPAVEAPVTAPIGRAGYLSNPSPRYPTIAQERSWEGKVLLRVHVRADGRPDQVELQQSSGRKVLDDSALETVRGWRFTPAQRGDTPIDGWVTVPIEFKLPN